MPWRNALVGNWYQGESFVPLLGLEATPTDPDNAWQQWTVASPYHTCASDDPYIYPGAPEGHLEIVVRATIPGIDHTIAEAAAAIELVCDSDDTPHDDTSAEGDTASAAEGDTANSATAVEGDTSNCSGGPIGSSAFILLALLRLRPRWSRRRSG